MHAAGRVLPQRGQVRDFAQWDGGVPVSIGGARGFSISLDRSAATRVDFALKALDLIGLHALSFLEWQE